MAFCSRSSSAADRTGMNAVPTTAIAATAISRCAVVRRRLFDAMFEQKFRVIVGLANVLEEPNRLAALAGRKARPVLLARHIDHMHRAVALAGDEQLVAME